MKTYIRVGGRAGERLQGWADVENKANVDVVSSYCLCNESYSAFLV